MSKEKKQQVDFDLSVLTLEELIEVFDLTQGFIGYLEKQKDEMTPKEVAK